MASLTIDPDKISEKAKLALGDMMKTPEGRFLAEKVRTKLKDLNEQFKDLSQDDKIKFLKEFKDKFADSFDELKNNLKSQLENSKLESENDEFRLEGDDDDSSSVPYSPQSNHILFLTAVIIILFVIGINHLIICF